MREGHDAGRVCVCVSRHVPTPAELHRHHAHPLSMGGPEDGEAVWLCLPPGAAVLMADGTERPIEDVRPGERVIGHDRLPHRVTATMARPFVGEVAVVHGCAMTTNHLVLTDRGWVQAGQLQAVDRVVHVEPTGSTLSLVAVAAESTTLVAHGCGFTESASGPLPGPPFDPAPASVPGDVMVRPEVFRVRSDEFKVLNPVVGSVMVAVVDDLLIRQASAEALLHDPSVLGEFSPLVAFPDDDVAVALGVQPSIALPLEGPRDSLESGQTATVGAVNVDLDPAQSGVLAAEGDGALRTLAPPAGLIRRSRLVGTVPRKRYSGHVYDLSVEGSNSFIADSIAVHNCPTSHVDCHELIRRWIQHNGEPPWSVRKFFGRYVRDLAERAYRAWDEAGRP